MTILITGAAGFIGIALAQQPAAGSLSISWATARQVSNTSGGQDGTTSATKAADVTYTIKTVPEYYVPGDSGGGGGGGGGGGSSGVLSATANVTYPTTLISR